MAHLIAKMTQIPRQYYRCHRMEKEAHYILFQVIRALWICWKLKNSGTQEEFDEGIAKVKFLRVKSTSVFAKLYRIMCGMLHNIFILVVQWTCSGILKQVIVVSFKRWLGGTVFFGCLSTSKVNRFFIVTSTQKKIKTVWLLCLGFTFIQLESTWTLNMVHFTHLHMV